MGKERGKREGYIVSYCIVRVENCITSPCHETCRVMPDHRDLQLFTGHLRTVMSRAEGPSGFPLPSAPAAPI